MQSHEILKHQTLSAWTMELITVLLAAIGVQQYAVLLLEIALVPALLMGVSTIIGIVVTRVALSYWMFGGVA